MILVKKIVIRPEEAKIIFKVDVDKDNKIVKDHIIGNREAAIGNFNKFRKINHYSYNNNNNN